MDVLLAIDLVSMRANAHSAARLLKILANENRLLLLCALIEGESSVSALNEKVNLSQSALSQHLALLREEGLVTTRRDSQNIYYAIANSKALPVIRALHDIYCT
ncbi:MAG: metalloregulator ArsR/SmtB family transcription factor [Pseudomonadales bacterium]